MLFSKLKTSFDNERNKILRSLLKYLNKIKLEKMRYEVEEHNLWITLENINKSTKIINKILL